MTKWTHNSSSVWHFLIQIIKCRNFCKISFLIGGQGHVVTKWLHLWPNGHQNLCPRGFSTQVWHQYPNFFIWLKLSTSPNLKFHFPKILNVFYIKIQILLHHPFPVKYNSSSGSGCDETTEFVTKWMTILFFDDNF